MTERRVCGKKRPVFGAQAQEGSGLPTEGREKKSRMGDCGLSSCLYVLLLWLSYVQHTSLPRMTDSCPSTSWAPGQAPMPVGMECDTACGRTARAWSKCSVNIGWEHLKTGCRRPLCGLLSLQSKSHLTYIPFIWFIDILLLR